MVGGRWVGGGPVGGSVVGSRCSVGWWRTCRWVSGRLSVVGGFVIRRQTSKIQSFAKIVNG